MHRFPFRFDSRFRVPLALVGVTPSTAEVTVDDHLDVRFGPWRLRTPVDNVADAHHDGPHKAYRAVGPRLSLADHGVTFGTSPVATTCVHLVEPVPGLAPLGLLRHPTVSLSVVDTAGLADLLRRLAGPSD